MPISPKLRKHLVALRAAGTGSPDTYVFGEAPDRAFAQSTIYRRARADWEALFEAVDWIIAEQREFIAWWDNKVRAAQRPKKELSPSRDSFLSVAPG